MCVCVLVLSKQNTKGLKRFSPNCEKQKVRRKFIIIFSILIIAMKMLLIITLFGKTNIASYT